MARELSELVEEIKSWFESYLDSREYQHTEMSSRKDLFDGWYYGYEIRIQDVTGECIGSQRVYFFFHPDWKALSGIQVYTDIDKPLEVDSSNAFTRWETSIKTEFTCDPHSQLPFDVYKTQLIEILEHNRMILKGTMRM